VDIVSVERRSDIMRRVHSKSTSAELVVRRLTYAMGYRYRLNCEYLPGKPDLVFAGRKKVIFVHGCFWHGHEGCNRARLPQANREYWSTKINRNAQRDRAQLTMLNGKGWRTLVIWECELRDAIAVQTRIKEFLDG